MPRSFSIGRAARRRLGGLCILLLAAGWACRAATLPGAGPTPTPAAIASVEADRLAPLPPRLAQVRTWGYQLQQIDPAALAAAGFDLLVIEPVDDDGRRWSAADLSALRAAGSLVLAYLSIGEAEDYRPYWRREWDADRDGVPDEGAPAWLDAENPDWEGNYKVHYWDAAWQSLIAAEIDALASEGYDGVYLDIVDAYAYYLDAGREAAPQEMADFVAAIGRRGRAAAPEFLVFPQNASGLLDDLPTPAAAADYLEAIDGIGAEDTFFYAGEPMEDAPLNPQAEVLAQLDRFRAAGKLVLVVDYVTQAEKVALLAELAREHGFVPYAGRLALDELGPPLPRLIMGRP
jgi:cysteinyl-tRNA synthetase